MNFFENEFIKIFNDMDVDCFDKSCYLTISDDLNVKVEFITCKFVNQYEALRIKIINKRNGVVDSMTLKFKDLFGTKALNDMGISFYIWIYQNKIEWYEYKPSLNDYKTIRSKIYDFINIFKHN